MKCFTLQGEGQTTKNTACTEVIHENGRIKTIPEKQKLREYINPTGNAKETSSNRKQ
jgi:hypothetical protein